MAFLQSLQSSWGFLAFSGARGIIGIKSSGHNRFRYFLENLRKNFGRLNSRAGRPTNG